MFIDETGLNTKLARLYGRCPIGQRCRSAVPHGHRQSSTFIAALRHENIAAPFLIEGPVDAEVFTVYLTNLQMEYRHGATITVYDANGNVVGTCQIQKDRNIQKNEGLACPVENSTAPP